MSFQNKFLFTVITGCSLLFYLNANFASSANFRQEEKNKKQALKSKDPFTIKTYKSEGGWGYDILKNGKLLIHQPHIPAVQGVKAFATEKEAKKVAAVMVKKIKKNIMPPTVEIKELDSLKIKY